MGSMTGQRQSRGRCSMKFRRPCKGKAAGMTAGKMTAGKVRIYALYYTKEPGQLDWSTNKSSTT